MFTFCVQPPVVKTNMNEVEAYNIHIITEFDILSGYYIHTEFDKSLAP